MNALSGTAINEVFRQIKTGKVNINTSVEEIYIGGYIYLLEEQ